MDRIDYLFARNRGTPFVFQTGYTEDEVFFPTDHFGKTGDEAFEKAKVFYEKHFDTSITPKDGVFYYIADNGGLEDLCVIRECNLYGQYGLTEEQLGKYYDQ